MRQPPNDLHLSDRVELHGGCVEEEGPNRMQSPSRQGHVDVLQGDRDKGSQKNVSVTRPLRQVWYWVVFCMDRNFLTFVLMKCIKGYEEAVKEGPEAYVLLAIISRNRTLDLLFVPLTLILSPGRLHRVTRSSSFEMHFARSSLALYSSWWYKKIVFDDQPPLLYLLHCF